MVKAAGTDTISSGRTWFIKAWRKEEEIELQPDGSSQKLARLTTASGVTTSTKYAKRLTM